MNKRILAQIIQHPHAPVVFDDPPITPEDARLQLERDRVELDAQYVQHVADCKLELMKVVDVYGYPLVMRLLKAYAPLVDTAMFGDVRR